MPLAARIISSSRDIPVLDARWGARDIGLVRMDSPGAEDAARSCRATRRGGGWHVARSDPFPFDALAPHLPRTAQRSLVPELVDLIPASSWFASLANMLVASSWANLRGPVIAHQGGCEECGVRSGLEGHELWSYDAAVGRQKLVGLRALCFLCHETQHLGRANVAGRFDRVFDRLCRANRLMEHERGSYRDEVFDRWETRSKREWELDLSVAGDMTLALKSSILYAGDNWVVQPASSHRGEVASRIVNAEVLSDGRRLVVVARGTYAAQA